MVLYGAKWCQVVQSVVQWGKLSRVVQKDGAVQNSVKWCKIMKNGRAVQGGAKMMAGSVAK